MLLLTATTDKLQLTTSSTAAVDVHASFMDATQANPPVVQGDTSGRQNTAITTATTTDICAGPAASETRNVKTITARNKSTTATNDVTFIFDQNGTDFELFKATLQPGDTAEFIEGIGWFVVQSTRKAYYNRRVTTDVVNATTSFADVTGLTCPVLSGKHYNFEAHLIHKANATTTGAFWAVNGPTVTAMRLSGLDTVTGNVAAAAVAAQSADITARDTNLIVETTSSVTPVLMILTGWMNPSADGTFAVRCASEVAVAAGLTVMAGSWLQLWESDN